MPDFNQIPKDQYSEHRSELIDAYSGVRGYSRRISASYSESEQQIQSMPDASPTKWHLAHTTWFFETFILQRFEPDFAWFNERFCYLFNSYYHAIGKQYPRPQRGLIVDPDLKTVWTYRETTDERLLQLLKQVSAEDFAVIAPLLVLGLNHEQQHQELMITDIKHGLFQGASAPSVKSGDQVRSVKSEPDWLEHSGGVTGLGYCGSGFCFDNELSNHSVLMQPFRMASRPVSAGEWLEFMADGGYEQPLLWLSDGWQWRQENNINSPLYWQNLHGEWYGFDTTNWKKIRHSEPVKHISYFEADAFAQWAGARLPRESEWEVMAFDDLLTERGHCWEWTQSAYSPYPGFRPMPGSAGEYNGKFMINQMVLRGSSEATSENHSRYSYRNFFYPHARWQFSGLRLARDA